MHNFRSDGWNDVINMGGNGKTCRMHRVNEKRIEKFGGRIWKE